MEENRMENVEVVNTEDYEAKEADNGFSVGTMLLLAGAGVAGHFIIEGGKKAFKFGKKKYGEHKAKKAAKEKVIDGEATEVEEEVESEE